MASFRGRGKTHAVEIASLTGGACDFIDFTDTEGRLCFSGMVYYREAEFYPWASFRLFLLASADRSGRGDLEDYDLAAVRSSEAEWYMMHRVGAVLAKRIDMSGENMSIQGVFYWLSNPKLCRIFSKSDAH